MLDSYVRGAFPYLTFVTKWFQHSLVFLFSFCDLGNFTHSFLFQGPTTYTNVGLLTKKNVIINFKLVIWIFSGCFVNQRGKKNKDWWWVWLFQNPKKKMQDDNVESFHSLNTSYGREKEICFSISNSMQCKFHLMMNELTHTKIKHPIPTNILPKLCNYKCDTCKFIFWFSL